MRTLVVALMTVAVVLAGCTDDSYEPVEPEPCVVVDPTDTHCLTEDELANKTADQVAHVHDYWNNRETVPLMEVSEVDVSGGYAWCDGAYPIQDMLPGDGAVVFQGTGLMNITMAAVIDEEEYNAGPMELWVKRADDDTPHFEGLFEDGGTITLEVAEEEADLPHQLLSAWEFWIYAEAGEGSGTPGSTDCPVDPEATVGLAVDITKTRDPPVFPGHPDHWGNDDEIVVMEAWASILQAREQGEPGTVSPCNSNGESSHPVSPCQMWWRGFGPLGNVIVPPGTEELLVVVDSDANGDAAVPPELGLRYHGANTRSWTPVEPDEVDGSVKTYRIELEPIEADGPYAQASQVRFFVDDQSAYQTYRGTFEVTATAIKD